MADKLAGHPLFAVNKMDTAMMAVKELEEKFDEVTDEQLLTGLTEIRVYLQEALADIRGAIK